MEQSAEQAISDGREPEGTVERQAIGVVVAKASVSQDGVATARRPKRTVLSKEQ